MKDGTVSIDIIPLTRGGKLFIIGNHNDADITGLFENVKNSKQGEEDIVLCFPQPVKVISHG